MLYIFDGNGRIGILGFCNRHGFDWPMLRMNV